MPLKDWSFAALDVETTGLDLSSGHEIVEIAVVAFDAHGIQERWSTLVKPERPIPREAVQIHGIRDADVARAPRIADVLPLVEEKTRGRVLVLHNAPFDLEFVTGACHRANLQPIDRPLIDTLILSRRCYAPDAGHSLTELAARLGVAPEGAHRALADSVTTANVMLALMRRASAREGRDLLSAGEVARVERHPALAPAECEASPAA